MSIFSKAAGLMHGPRSNYPKRLFCSLFALTVFFPAFLSNALGEPIRSRAAVVMDGATGQVLYTKNSSRWLPPASTTKLMTAIVAIENENLSTVTTISKNATRVHPSKAGFKEGDRITLEGLLYTALLESANDAAVAIAEAVAGTEKHFVLLMNRKATAIGAMNTRFINATGLPGPGQHITALDLSSIMRYAMKLPRLREIIGTPVTRISTEEGKALLLKSTDKLLGSDDGVIGGKTGYTNSAKHCFVCVAEQDKKVIIVSVLGSPSRKMLWKETKKLIAKGFDKI